MTPAVAGDTVFIGSCAGVYYALDVVSGSVVWSHDFNKDVGQATFHGDPLLTDDLVITGTESLTPVQMRAFDQRTGHVAWSRTGEWAFTRSDVVGVAHLAIGRNSRGELVALDARSGEPVWHVTHRNGSFRADIAESPAVRGSMVVFSAPDGAVYQVESGSGAVRWRTDIACDVSTSIAVDGEDLYLGCSTGKLFLLSFEDGAVRSTIALNQPLEGRLLVLPDRLVVPGGSKWIGAVDRRLTEIIWQRSPDARLSVVQPIAWNGTILTGTRGQLIALRIDDGSTVWTHDLKGSIRGLGQHQDVLLVGTVEGTVYALRTREAPPAQGVDTVRVGDPALAGARLPAGIEAVESFMRAEGVDNPISRTTREITRTRQDGEDVYVIHTVHASADGDTTVGTIVVRANDFRLIHHRVKAARDSAAVTAHGAQLTGWVALPDEPVSLLDQRFDHPVFPIEGQMPWLFPLLPLEVGYTAAIPHYSEWAGREEWSTIRVVASESIQHRGRTIDCWKVDAGELGPPGYRATAWVEKRTRRILRSTLAGPGEGPEYWAVAGTN